jgi:transposase-like protein
MKHAKEKTLVNIRNLIDLEECYRTVRELRWPQESTFCPWCGSKNVVKNGRDKTHPECQHYQCKLCKKYFDDLTNTVFSGHHQPLSIWILCLYFMGLNISNSQIAEELDLCKSDVQEMTMKLREGIAAKRSEVILEGEVEFDEVYVVAGHKGQPNAVEKKGAKEEETD